MIEDQMADRRIRQVRADVPGPQVGFAVLDVLRVHEHDLVDEVQLFEQDRADQTVEIAAGHQSVLL